MATLKENIWNIFLKLGCNTPANRELLGEDGVTDENMMPYLGVIEQRTNEILQMFAASKAASKGNVARGLVVQIAARAGASDGAERDADPDRAPEHGGSARGRRRR